MSTASTRLADASILARNIDITEIHVDPFDTFQQYVDFFTLFRHICHKMATN